MPIIINPLWNNSFHLNDSSLTGAWIACIDMCSQNCINDIIRDLLCILLEVHTPTRATWLSYSGSKKLFRFPAGFWTKLLVHRGINPTSCRYSRMFPLPKHINLPDSTQKHSHCYLHWIAMYNKTAFTDLLFYILAANLVTRWTDKLQNLHNFV